MDDVIKQLHERLPHRASWALDQLKVETVGQLEGLGRDDLLSLRGVGYATVNEIERVMQTCGLAFKGPLFYRPTKVISGTLVAAFHGVHPAHTTGTFEILLDKKSVFPSLKAGCKARVIIEEPTDARQ